MRLYELIKQDQYEPMEVEEQVVVLFAGVRGFIDRIDVDQCRQFEADWLSFLKTSHYDSTIGAIKKGMEITPEIDAKLTALCDEYSASYAK